jgi:uncharacterized protein (DUF952 family)
MMNAGRPIPPPLPGGKGRIYHITARKQWKAALSKGYYDAPSLATEGFIHCSEENQVAGVLDRYYKGVQDLIKLSIDPSLLTAPLKYELSPSVNESFPHVYGPINLEAVIEIAQIP